MKLLAALCFGTICVVSGGLNLLDGEITLRTLGHVSVGASPVRFGLFAAVYAMACAMVALGWSVLRSEWQTDYRPRWKPPLDEPAHRRKL